MKKLIYIFCLFLLSTSARADQAHVAVMDMDMGIFPGSASYLDKTIREAHAAGAKVLIVQLDTPGGMLNTAQDMVKTIFDAPLPVIFYVGPTGSTATSAGVFVTLAAHVAAMAPGTTIGAAHPVSGDGKDIEKDMRAKVENMTVAMVKSISEQRGRNVKWAEKAVKDSDSLTESQALKEGVVDLVAEDIPTLLKRIKGKEVLVQKQRLVLEDYSALPRLNYDISFKDKTINVLADPNIAALLWLGATTGLSLELYHPGAILPGVVGVICLILALATYQIIPINIGGILLLVLGVVMIGAELVMPSGILGIGGLIALVLGAIYLVDIAQEPGLAVNLYYIGVTAAALGALMLSVVYAVLRSYRRQVTTGAEGLIGKVGEVLDTVSSSGRVSLNGEIWKAYSSEGIIEKGSQVTVVKVGPGLSVQVKRQA